MPWCIIGDFNVLANPLQKREGQIYSSSKFLRLNTFLNRINAVFVLVSGSIYTWEKRIHMKLIYERLDRLIVCKDWMHVYPDSMVTHGNFSCLDHYPIILLSLTLFQ